MSRSMLALVVSAVVLPSVSGCAGAVHMSSAREAAAAAPAPAPLERSLFARDPAGTLGEEALQRILAAPIELELPARVGLLPVVTATDWRGPSPDYQRVPAGLSAFARALRGSDSFSLVTEMLPIPSGALGMEALREAAARYRLRYIVLYREQLTRQSRLRPAALGYVTVVGALFVPGQRLEVDGVVEASLFDVKTGLLLFTVRRRVTGARGSSVWYQGDKLGRLEAEVTERLGPTLAEDVRGDVLRYAEAARVERDRRAAAP